MPTYTIRIYNQSGVSKSYAAFMGPPKVVSKGSDTPVYTNAWAIFPHLTSGSWDSVTYTETFYAYWSAKDKAMTPGATLDSGGIMPVNIATRDTVYFTNTGATGFKGLQSPGSAPEASFSIVATTDFTPANGFIFGLAQENGSSIPGPVATFPALPNETYNVTPVVNFWVTDGDYVPGQVVDIGQVSSAMAAIDFTGRPQTTSTVTQGANGAFTVSYD